MYDENDGQFDHVVPPLPPAGTRFGAEVPNLTAWRRATCGDLTSAFDFRTAPRLDLPVLPETIERLASIYEAVPTLPKPDVPKTQTMPVQESGTRPRRA